MRDGLAEGMDACARAGRPIVAQQIVTSMWHLPADDRVAQLAVDHRHDSVCGFDIAGAEDGFPPTLHASSFALLRRAGVPYTIHAGEAAGAASIREAVFECGATRIGHGVRLVEDIRHTADGYVLGDRGRLDPQDQGSRRGSPDVERPRPACATRSPRTPSGCSTTRASATVSCDNRLMSATTLSRELGLLADAFDYGVADPVGSP